MDKSIPAAAGYILDGISKPESNGDYDTYNAFKQAKLPKKLTKMTLQEVLDINWKDIGANSSAAGRYQIIKKTLLGLIADIGLSKSTLFTANLQDRLAYHLLRGRGYDQWARGEISHIEFGKRLAMEWASLPVLAGTKNYKGVNIKRGSSYYAGDGLNSHGVSADAFESMLEDAFTKHERFFYEGKPAKVDIPTTVGTGVATGIAVGVGTGAAVIEATDGLTSIPDIDTLIKIGTALQGALQSGNIVVTGVVLVGLAAGAWWWFTKR